MQERSRPARAPGDGSAPGAARSERAARWRLAVALVGLCSVALGVRILFASHGGVWRDEAQALWIIRMPSVGAMMEFLRHNECHPPGFYLLMRLWFSVFGRSQAAALALPILLGGALVPVAYLVGSRMLGARCGQVAAVLMALSTTLILFSTEIRPYSLVPLLCLTSCYFLWRGLLEGGLRCWVAYAATTLAMLLSHNWSLLVWGAQWVTVGAWFLWQRREVRGERLGQWALAQLVLGVAYLPWVPAVLYQARHTAPPPAPFLSLDVPLGDLLESTTSLPKWVAVAFLVGLVGAALWRHVAGSRAAEAPMPQSRRLALSLMIGTPVVAFVAAAALTAWAGLMQHHCLVILAPCMLLAISYGIARLSPDHRLLWPLVVAGTLVAVYLAEAVVFSGRIKSNAREVAGLMAKRVRPDDLIVIAPGWLASSFNYYYRADNPQIGFPDEGRQSAIAWDDWWLRLADPGIISRVRERLTRAHLEGRRVWLVMERGTIDDRLPERDALREGPDPVPVALLAPSRANQLRKFLVTCYGPPELCGVPPAGRYCKEIMVALLFDPRPPARVTDTGGE
jgi:hypothetical protein